MRSYDFLSLGNKGILKEGTIEKWWVGWTSNRSDIIKDFLGLSFRYQQIYQQKK